MSKSKKKGVGDELPLDDAELYEGPEEGTYTDAENIEKILDFIVDQEQNAFVAVAFCTDGDNEDSYFANVDLPGGEYTKSPRGIYTFAAGEDELAEANFNLSEVFEIEVMDDGSYNISVELDPNLEH